MVPRIFIGGTGRSGTTILYQSLGCHDDIYALPREMRFIIEPDGLVDLVDALTVRYSSNQSREALVNFEELMRIRLASSNPYRTYYPGYDLPRWLGGDYYFRRLDEYCSRLMQLEYDGLTVPIKPPLEGNIKEMVVSRLRTYKRELTKKPPPIRLRQVGMIRKVKAVKYFSDRQELIDLTADFVDDLFMYPARSNGKKTWCEKTPTNLQYIDFLWELFPDSLFIHVMRDPRGVVRSMSRVRWAPNDVRDICLFLQNIYDRWFDLKESVDLEGHKFLELKLEELIAHPQETLGHIASLCGLPDRYVDIPEIALEKVNTWQSILSKEDVQVINQMLGPYIERLGYTI